MNNIIKLHTRFTDNSLISWTDIHTYNACSSLGPICALKVFNMVIGKVPLLDTPLQGLAEKTAYNTFTELYEESRKYKIEMTWQQLVLDNINHYNTKGDNK